MCSSMEWDFLKIVENAVKSGQLGSSPVEYAIIMLNQPVINEDLFISLWNAATLRVVVDGGGNHWRLLHRKFSDLVQLPHIVSGDFDSIRREVTDFFKLKADEIELVCTPDQNETDFTKAVRLLNERLDERDVNVTKIIAFCETGGRLDQIMGNIETLHQSLKIMPKRDMALVGSCSLTWLLPPGKHRIFCGIGSSPDVEVQYCSLIPIGLPSKGVVTSGLKWNLTEDMVLSFGHLISTSNEVDKHPEDKPHPSRCEQILSVSVDNSVNTAPLLWSMELQFPNQPKHASW